MMSRSKPQSFLGPENKKFKTYFHAKGKDARSKQIEANHYAAHLREEFKRALINGSDPTTKEII